MGNRHSTNWTWRSRREENVLYDLVAKERWEKAMARVRTAEGTEELGRPNEDGCLPVHMACQGFAPLELVGAMVGGYPEALKVTDVDGSLPLHDACWYDGVSPLVVRLLLDAHTEGAKAKDNQGKLPVHYAASNEAPLAKLTMLLDAHPDGAKAKDDGDWLPIHHAASNKAPLALLTTLLDAHPDGAKAKDDGDWLPIHLLEIDGDASPDEEDDVNKVEVLIRPLLDDEEAYLVPHPYNSGETPLHIAAKFDVLRLHEYVELRRCPPDVIMMVAKRHPEQLRERDENGNLPLHVVAANPHLNGATVGGKDLIGELVKLYPEAAATPDGEGRFPLVLAIESGKKWNEGVEALADVAEYVVTVRDEATNLYPFMLAATVDDACLTTVYSLLRRCPELKRYILE